MSSPTSSVATWSGECSLLLACSLLSSGPRFSRSCEYTCNRFAAFYHPAGAVKGLLVLAAGKYLYRQVNVQALCEQAEREYDSWVWLAEIIEAHPNLPQQVRGPAQPGSIHSGQLSLS